MDFGAAGWTGVSIRPKLERPRQGREPSIEDLCRLARGFELEQGPVDEVREAWLVLLDPEPGSSRQCVVGNEGEVLRRSAPLRERQQQKLIGQKAVDAPRP